MTALKLDAHTIRRAEQDAADLDAGGTRRRYLTYTRKPPVGDGWARRVETQEGEGTR